MTGRGFDEVAAVLERHGATVARSLGGAVTAIFGVPSVHEDDALRAVRAAAEMRDRLAGLRGELEASWARGSSCAPASARARSCRAATAPSRT